MNIAMTALKLGSSWLYFVPKLNGTFRIIQTKIIYRAKLLYANSSNDLSEAWGLKKNRNDIPRSFRLPCQSGSLVHLVHLI